MGIYEKIFFIWENIFWSINKKWRCGHHVHRGWLDVILQKWWHHLENCKSSRSRWRKLLRLAFFAIFEPLTGIKLLSNHFYLVGEVLSFNLVGHMWKLVKNWLQEWVFNIYKSKLGRSRWIAYFENYLQQDFPARFSCKIFPQDFPQDFSQDFLQDFPTRFSHSISYKIFPQGFPTRFPARFSHKIFPWDFPTRFPTRFSPNHFPQEFPTSLSCKIFLQEFPTRISHKIFPQDFPARFSQAGSWLVGSLSPYSKC